MAGLISIWNRQKLSSKRLESWVMYRPGCGNQQTRVKSIVNLSFKTHKMTLYNTLILGICFSVLVKRIRDTACLSPLHMHAISLHAASPSQSRSLHSINYLWLAENSKVDQDHENTVGSLIRLVDEVDL